MGRISKALKRLHRSHRKHNPDLKLKDFATNRASRDTKRRGDNEEIYLASTWCKNKGIDF